MKTTTSKGMRQRVTAVTCVLAALFLIVCGRFFQLQIIDGAKYQSIAINQQTREITVAAKRGTIYDRNGKALAVSATAYKIVLSPSSVSDEEDRELLIRNLPAILGVETSVIEKSLSRKTYYDVVARKVEQETADAVRSFVREHSLGGIVSIVEDPKRYYPYNDFACHILGFVGVDSQGLAGLEAQYDEYLRGTDGVVVRATDAVGNNLSLLDYEKYIPAIDGYNLNTTIDETIQHYLEKRLKTAYEQRQLTGYAGGIVMDIKTGGILAMASIPGFDLNMTFTITDEKVLSSIAALPEEEQSNARVDALNAMWRNELISDPYEPGSTFKIITSSIAVEEDLVGDQSSFYCPGYKIVAGTHISCANHDGHGSETFQQALNNSCNPAFMDIGEIIGAEIFDSYMTGFGFRSRTGIDLPGEGTGILHPLSDMGPVQLATSAFGQTFKITPIQLITAISAVANGGKMMQPYLVESVTDAGGNVIESHEATQIKQVVSESTATKLCSMLETVVSEGGGHNAYAAGFRVCGKSGTSQKIDQKHEDGTYEHTASFVAFAPADDPQIAILVILDEPQTSPIYGATIAGPVVGNLMEEILTYLDVSPQYTEEEATKQDVSLPSVVGSQSGVAQSALSKYGVSARVIGGDGVVQRQVPAAGQLIPYGGTVLLYTNGAVPDEEIVVPNLTGKSIHYCTTELVNLGLNIRISGTTSSERDVFAVAQNPAAGSVVPAGTIITVEFRSQGTADD